MILNRITEDYDLSLHSVKQVCISLYCSSCPGGKLYVSTGAISLGVTIAEALNLSLFVDDELPSDSWYVKTEFQGIFSPGA